MTGEVGTHLHEDEDNKCDEDVGAGMVPGLQDAQVFKLITDPLLGPRLVVKECHQGVLLGELVKGRGQLGLVVALGWGTGVPPHCRYLASHELSKARRKGQRGDDQRHQGREEQTPGRATQGSG